MILGNQLCLGQKREVYVYQGSLQKREHFRIFLFRPRSKTDRESSGANRGRKGGARERADDVLLFRRNKRTSEQSGLCSDVSGGFNPDILPWNPCTATACKFPAKNTRNFFEVLLTLFEPPAEFNADITRPAFGTHPAAVLASILPLSADR